MADALLTSVPLQVWTYIEEFEYVPGVTPFSSVWTPIIATIAYFASIWGIEYYMKDKEPVNHPLMKTAMVYHNRLLSLYSGVSFVGVVVYCALDLRNKYAAGYSGYDPLFPLICDQEQTLGKGPVYFLFYVFYLSKMYEFLDTVFHKLKKHKTPFLHVYHHFITLWVCWTSLMVVQGAQFIDIGLNLMVHTVMYYYYSLTSAGVKGVWWKNYITQLQIVQFILDVTGHLLWFKYNAEQNDGCSGSYWNVWFTQIVIISFLLLFIKFYVDTYKRKGKRAKAKAAAKAGTKGEAKAEGNGQVAHTANGHAK